MWSRVKTIGLVSLIAALIWIWAEAESLKSTTVIARIAFVAGDAAAVRVAGSPLNDALQVRVRLEGPTQAIDQAQQILARTISLSPGSEGVPAAPGGTVALAEAIRQSREVSGTGVTVVSVDPPTASLAVVKLVAREMPVQVDVGGVDAEGEPVAVPPTVRVTMPEALSKSLSESLAVTAVVAPEDVAVTGDDGPQTVTARLRLPAALTQGDLAEFVAVSRETARVTLRVRKRLETLEIPTVPVWITMPPTEGKSWDVEVVEPFLRGVTATGPADQVQRLRRRELVAIAFVVLSSDELAAGITSKSAVIAPVSADLIGAGAGGGGGVSSPVSPSPEASGSEPATAVRFNADNRRVELRIRKRAPSPP